MGAKEDFEKTMGNVMEAITGVNKKVDEIHTKVFPKDDGKKDDSTPKRRKEDKDDSGASKRRKGDKGFFETLLG